MIPIKLALRNFMCYRDNVPPLHFDGFHVACLCGDNGNGKSALIDAITWALWGKARSRSDDDLIHIGQADMEVELEFASGENQYRVIRKRTKAGLKRAAAPVLELQVATEQGFTSISGNTITETQRKIVDILRLDYDTFINSALLLQGRANEFTTKKTPAERKQVLVNILHLSLYDELEDQAKELARERERSQSELERGVREIDEELAKKDGYQAELYEVQALSAELEAQIEEQRAALDELHQEKNGLELKKEQLSEAEKRIAQAEAELNSLEHQLSEHRQRVQEFESILELSSEIEAKYGELLAAKSEDQELNEKLRQLHGLTEDKNRLEQALTAARNELITEQSVLQNEVNRLQAKSEAAPGLEQELRQIQADSAQLDEMERELNQKRVQGQELSGQIHLLKATNAQLEVEIAELKSKVEQLRGDGLRCPLCETELGIEGRERIITKYEQDEEAKAKAHHGNESELAQKESELQEVTGEVTQLETRISKERATAQGREIALKKGLDEAQEATAKLEWDRSRLAQLAEILQREEFALTEKAAFRELEARIKSLDYDPERHKLVWEHLAELNAFEDSKRKLAEARGSIDRERALSARAEESASRWRSSRDAEVQRQAALTQELAALPEVTTKLAEAENAHSALLSRQAQLRQALGAINQKLEHCADLERSREEKVKGLAWAAEERGIYDELALAFSKKGIPALIIEQVLPELEDEANRMLARMTDNRMGVRLETQRLTKKGEPAETLEIKVSDELGTRNYEMFSGGEAFRIDFALRIALSKLLARRAGAPLPTLFIDEGFGSQDSSGREKLVEAINSIQDDFEKIIVITHIEELKDAFPVRIEVTKSAEGSTIQVS